MLDIHLALLLSLPWLHFARCAHNVTVNHQDPSIQYTPPASWIVSAPSTLDAAGTHMLTQDPAATATFTFTGVAVYFLSPLWPYAVNTAVSLDAAPPVLVDLVDHSRPTADGGPETVQSQVRWSAAGLANTKHTLVISVGARQSFAVVDALIYTTLDPASSATPPTSSMATFTAPLSTPSPPSSTSTSSSSSSSPHILPIILGTALGAIALLILLLLLICCCKRRRRRPVSEPWSVTGIPYAVASPGPPVSTVPPPPPPPGAANRDSGGSYGYEAAAGARASYDSGHAMPPTGTSTGRRTVPEVVRYSHGATSSIGTGAGLAGVGAGGMPDDDDDERAGEGEGEGEGDTDSWQGTTAQIAARYMSAPHQYYTHSYGRGDRAKLFPTPPTPRDSRGADRTVTVTAASMARSESSSAPSAGRWGSGG
ncbi:hypothetical protein H0H81_002475 [Sphagnurus paluster]|uniref:Uncharacterized protein n=1 Tax=Sphagnurus paluster TaxID=117069 RepID=A0A9P7K2M3_9AGAR|nr:hypothetical protein H0H81_002475 [Sphagnurus paluster]